MTRVVGVDGCRGGWLAAVAVDGTLHWEVVATFDGVLDLAGDDPLGVDMPLGPLPADGGRRRSDVAAREFLGPARSSIFWTPPASALARWRADPGHPRGIGVSIQTWNLLPKIAEVADALRLRPRAVLEVHPECSFRTLAPGVAFASKKTADGRRQRVDALADLGDVAGRRQHPGTVRRGRPRRHPSWPGRRPGGRAARPARCPRTRHRASRSIVV